MKKPTESKIPPSMEAPAGMHTLFADCRDTRTVSYLPDVVYATRDGIDLHLQMLYPGSVPMGIMFEKLKKEHPEMAAGDGPFAGRKPEPAEKNPLIIYVQGSAWFKQDCYRNLPALVDFARMGYVVASVEYRPSPVAPWPAFLQDVKAAIRYLRANADLFGVDPERVGVWGDSSGGHTALLVGSTGWTREFDDDLCPDQSSAVRCVVDFYGLSDITKLTHFPRDPENQQYDKTQPEDVLFRTRVLDHPEVAAPANPIAYIHPDKDYPPFLIFHGDGDGTVPFNQSVLMYEKLVAEGKQVDFYKVKGAGHGVRMWTPEVLDVVAQFFRAYL